MKSVLCDCLLFDRSDTSGSGSAAAGTPGDYLSRTMVPVSTLYGASPLRSDSGRALYSTTGYGGSGGSASPRSMFLSGTAVPTPYTAPLFTGRPQEALCRFCGRRVTVESLQAHEGVCVKNPRKNNY